MMKNLITLLMRISVLIDWSRGRNGNPYVWAILDKKVIDESECFCLLENLMRSLMRRL